MKKPMTTLVVMAACTCAFAQIPDQKPDFPLPEGVKMETFTFATREEGELKLDVYRDASFDGKDLPVFLYAFGPDVICPQLKAMDVPYHKYTSQEADHYMAGGPDYTASENPAAIDYTNQVFDFIDRVVILGEKVGIETSETVYGEPRTLEWAFKELFAKMTEELKKQQQ